MKIDSKDIEISESSFKVFFPGTFRQCGWSSVYRSRLPSLDNPICAVDLVLETIENSDSDQFRLLPASHLDCLSLDANDAKKFMLLLLFKR